MGLEYNFEKFLSFWVIRVEEFIFKGFNWVVFLFGNIIKLFFINVCVWDLFV